ncbi:hypothetical protein WA026_003061 [Henosepilachna vigintioctopunctata]|uniref:Homeobox domain-containing protein n=1 Tax=Henosepilachna vigintioctopunctata TaxID=420089 RepID=A0AAW1TL99_9CUCU
MATRSNSREGTEQSPSSSSSFSNFSIDHILNKAGEDNRRKNSENTDDSLYTRVKFAFDQFSWLQCTRYCPPKLPRNHRRDVPQRRQMGRHPRIPFTTQQLYILEEKFQQTAYLTGEEVMELAKRLQLADIRVKIWFQNRRARDRREKFSADTGKTIPQSENESKSEVPVTEDQQLRMFDRFR